ncbi:hypothetical protein KM043_009756 [Ampulex compressa]|nr:hypothetical protein KM043_009756 [Ampulex compressa]
MKMDNLEQQCEEATFEVSDAREQYPSKCANELQKYIQLTNNIHAMKVEARSHEHQDFSTITEQQSILLGTKFIKENVSLKHLDDKVKEMLHKFENLRCVMQQVEEEKACIFNKLLKD